MPKGLKKERRGVEKMLATYAVFRGARSFRERKKAEGRLRLHGEGKRKEGPSCLTSRWGSLEKDLKGTEKKKTRMSRIFRVARGGKGETPRRKRKKLLNVFFMYVGEGQGASLS